MKFLLSIMLVLLFFGCRDSKSDSDNQSTIADTTSLQPDITNRELQPPRPPAL